MLLESTIPKIDPVSWLVNGLCQLNYLAPKRDVGWVRPSWRSRHSAEPRQQNLKRYRAWFARNPVPLRPQFVSASPPSSGMSAIEKTGRRPRMTRIGLFCSLIPGPNASSLLASTGFTVLSAVGDQPPHHGVRRRCRINVESVLSSFAWSHEIGRSRQHRRTGRNIKAVRSD